MTLKLLFDPDTGKILVPKSWRTSVTSGLMSWRSPFKAGMTVYDLEEAELCYAPQFGSAKDPINMPALSQAAFCVATIRRHNLGTSARFGSDGGRCSHADRIRERTYCAGHQYPVDDLRIGLPSCPRISRLSFIVRSASGVISRPESCCKRLRREEPGGGYKTYLLYQPS